MFQLFLIWEICKVYQNHNPNSSIAKLMRKMFQFHYGAIKTRKKINVSFSIDGFNSTMVRLKPPNGAGLAVRLEEFQFHYGAIKTINPSANPSETSRVSIPLWCD